MSAVGAPLVEHARVDVLLRDDKVIALVHQGVSIGPRQTGTGHATGADPCGAQDALATGASIGVMTWK